MMPPNRPPGPKHTLPLPAISALCGALLLAALAIVPLFFLGGPEPELVPPPPGAAPAGPQPQIAEPQGDIAAAQRDIAAPQTEPPPQLAGGQRAPDDEEGPWPAGPERDERPQPDSERSQADRSTKTSQEPGSQVDRHTPPPASQPGDQPPGEPAPATQPATAPATQPATAPAEPESELRRKRRERMAQFGGTPLTDNAVEAGLAWLAAHQHPDGRWDRIEYHHLCPANDRCWGNAISRETRDLDAGMTGLCLLAYFGAGYTDRDGPYRDTVARGVAYLLSRQQVHGGFGPSDAMAGYNDSVAAFALAEYYDLTEDGRVREPLERALARLGNSQQRLGGWDYLPTRISGRNDTSITAWAVQAMQAGAVAGVRVPRHSLVGAALHFVRATERDGRVRYSDGGIGTRIERNGKMTFRYGPAMIACGATSAPLLGWRLDSPMLRQQHALLLGDLPSQSRARGGDPLDLHNEYYWYYGTVAMFQVGGEHWERWNAALRDALLPLQDRRKSPDGRKRHSFGSWQPYSEDWGRWGKMGSRLYSTALSVLTLEVYYRHTPAWLEDHTAVTADDWRAYLETSDPTERALAVECLRNMRVEIGEPVLLDLLHDREPGVGLAAAEGLADLGSPIGRELIARRLEELPRPQQMRYRGVLARIEELDALPAAIGSVRLVDMEEGLITAELARSYVGMPVEVRRGGAPVARLEVVQRFSDRPLIVAQMRMLLMQGPPQAGDEVVSLPLRMRP